MKIKKTIRKRSTPNAEGDAANQPAAEQGGAHNLVQIYENLISIDLGLSKAQTKSSSSFGLAHADMKRLKKELKARNNTMQDVQNVRAYLYEIAKRKRTVVEEEFPFYDGKTDEKRAELAAYLGLEWSKATRGPFATAAQLERSA